MPSAAATYPRVTAFNARTYAARDYRRAVCGGAVLGVGSLAAVATMAGTVAVAAAWMVAGTLSGNPALRARAPSVLEMAAFPRPSMRLAEPADMFGSALASANPAYAPDLTREAELSAPAVPASASASAPQSGPAQTADLTNSVPLPPRRPSYVASIPVKTIIFRPPAAAPLAAAPLAAAPAAAREPHDVRRDAAVSHEARKPPEMRDELKVAAVRPGSAALPAAAAMAAPAAPAMTGSINAVAKPAAPVLAYNNPDVPPARDSHTAIYDIVAHTVYLPDGERLEAHSGLGRMLDDPHYVSEKARGPTPPNTYDLTLRGGLFHGVQAIRLNPVADSKMFGRDGILAHTYMLGPSGQSFGCVSFKNYQEFLHAFLRGEVNRMVVVPHLPSPPPAPSAARASRDDGKRYAFDLESGR